MTEIALFDAKLSGCTAKTVWVDNALLAPAAGPAAVAPAALDH